MQAAIDYLEYKKKGLENSIKKFTIYPEIKESDKKALKEVKEAIKLIKQNL